MAIGNGVVAIPGVNDFSLTWRNLSYEASGSLLGRKKLILSNLNGSMRSGELIGIMGSGGSGKSVLIECLIGRRIHGVTGDIILFHENSTKDNHKLKSSKNYRMYHTPQVDTLYPTLTGRECVLFSSQLRNRTYSKHQHVQSCDQTMKDLNIAACSDNLIYKCSGGQQKRISIAMELISNPDILVLDEPTSGLDSAACVSLLHLLASVANGSRSGSKCLIVISIHQPTEPAFLCLDRVIVLSCLSGPGRIIYSGAPGNVSRTLSSIRVPCPVEENPANVLMEVASGCHGEIAVHQMIVMERQQAREHLSDYNPEQVQKITDVSPGFRSDVPIFLLLSARWFLILNRDPLMLVMRIVTSISFVCMSYLIFEDSGTANSCMVKDWDIRNSSNLVTYCIDNYMDCIAYRSNYILVFSITMVGFAMSVGPVVFSMINNLVPITKEIRNNWYSCVTFWIVQTIVEALITMVIVILLFILPIYYLTEQKDDFERLFNVTLVLLIVMIAGQAFFSAMTIALIDDKVSCATACLVTMFPMCAACNYAMPSRDMSKTANIIFMMNPIRWTFDAIMVAMYGDDLCGSLEESEDQVTQIRDSVYSLMHDLRNDGMNAYALVNRSIIYPNEGKDADLRFTAETLSSLFIQPFRTRKGDLGSAVMADFDLEDDDLWKSCVFIVAIFLIQRAFGLLLFYIRISRKN